MLNLSSLNHSARQWLTPHLGQQRDGGPKTRALHLTETLEVDVAVTFRPDEVLELIFAVGSEEKDETAHVRLSGEFDLAGMPLFVQELERLQRRGRDVAVLDLAQVVFIDAVGLEAVLAVGERGSDNSPSPALVGARPAVSRVFELVGLDHHLADRL